MRITPDNTHSFSYENLFNVFCSGNKIKKLPRYHNYHAMVEPSQPNFISIKNESNPTEPHKDFQEFFSQENADETGKSNYQAKLHVSIKEDYISQGWNLIKDILISHHINYFKVIKPGKKLSVLCLSQQAHLLEDQCGKDITIYLFKNREKNINDWAIIVKEVVEVLIKNDIPAGYKVTSEGSRGDTKIPNIPPYVSYRYEGSERLRPSDPLCKMQINIDLELSKKYDNNKSLHATETRPWDTKTTSKITNTPNIINNTKKDSSSTSSERSSLESSDSNSDFSSDSNEALKTKNTPQFNNSSSPSPDTGGDDSKPKKTKFTFLLNLNKLPNQTPPKKDDLNDEAHNTSGFEKK